MKKIALAVLAITAAGLPIAIVACKTQSTEVTAPASASVAASASASVSAAVSVSVSASVSASAPLDCGKAFNAMQVGPDAVRKKYASCKSDSDCAIVSGRACLASCGASINSAGVSEYERAIKATEPACSVWFSGPCIRTYPIAIPTCPPITPKCENGKCVGRYP